MMVEATNSKAVDNEGVIVFRLFDVERKKVLDTSQILFLGRFRDVVQWKTESSVFP